MRIQVSNTISRTECFSRTGDEITSQLVLYYGNHNDFENSMERFYAFLSEKEMQRSKRFRNAADERVYVISHAFTNRKVAEHLNKQFNQLSIRYFDNCKPYIVGHPIDFNLSHSSDYFAFAVCLSKNVLVGVDIEELNENLDIKPIVNNYFHENEKDYVLNNLLNSFDRRHRFYEIWTRKEALLKMLGTGLTDKLTDLDLTEGERELDLVQPVLSGFANTAKTYVHTFILSPTVVLSISANVLLRISPVKCTDF